MKRFYVIVLSVLLFSCQDEPEVELDSDQTLAQAVHALVNQHRESLGMPALEWEENCAMYALEHSENMASGALELGHDGFEARINKIFELTNAQSGGENVASGYQTAEAVVDGWLDSPGHRENIEGDFTHGGIGVVESADGEPFYTQIFIKI